MGQLPGSLVVSTDLLVGLLVGIIVTILFQQFTRAFFSQSGCPGCLGNLLTGIVFLVVALAMLTRWLDR